MLLEEQRGREVAKMVEENPNSVRSAAAEKPSRASKVFPFLNCVQLNCSHLILWF